MKLCKHNEIESFDIKYVFNAKTVVISTQDTSNLSNVAVTFDALKNDFDVIFVISMSALNVANISKTTPLLNCNFQ